MSAKVIKADFRGSGRGTWKIAEPGPDLAAIEAEIAAALSGTQWDPAVTTIAYELAGKDSA